MTNTFTLILFIATIITGLLWCLNKFILSSRQHKHQIYLLRVTFNKKLDEAIKNNKLVLDCLDNTASIFMILITVLTVRSFIYEPFQIPSGSMMPTLLIGDFILVEKFSYNIKDPIYHKTILEIGNPKRGDIVVFKYPKYPYIDYIKRVVGLPGDKVIYNPIKKEIIIQPKFVSDNTYESNLPIIYSDIRLSNFTQTFTQYDSKVNDCKFFELSKDKNKNDSIRLIERKETFGKVTHYILTLPVVQDQIEMYYQQPGQQIATWIVPIGQYFVMGDNRDNSSDSRYWGFVPKENLIGKARVIWMSLKKQEGEWPTGIRLNRIGYML